MAKRIPFPKFRLQTLLCLILLVALLFAWWKDRQALLAQIDDLRAPRRFWSTDQVLGPPDTPTAGDHTTAWASQTQDNRREWLILEFKKKCTPRAVWVFESYNPGAVDQVSVYDDENVEHVVWRGVDPTSKNAAMGTSKIPISFEGEITRVKIFLNSPAVPGWNEIDAVAIVDQDGNRQWASKAYSSSSFGKNNPVPNWFEEILE